MISKLRGSIWSGSGGVVNTLAFFVVALGGLAFLVGFGIFAWQVQRWWQTGGWVPRSVWDYAVWSGLTSPNGGWSWLRTFAGALPASLTGMVGGPFLIGVGAAMRNAIQRGRPDKKSARAGQ